MKMQPIRELKDQNYSNTNIIEMQYAVDITWISSSIKDLDKIFKTISTKLFQNNLTISKTKTERYCITRNHDFTWKKCKYLGTL